ncbi:CoA pyrophosphatase [Azospirillum thermophilum]|uniref:CoA pyrophosphatase n=2 Tax=Azospirillum thermophilum TaxID=2202148 RepID=A0A2S2CLW3_9PROT|nr:CoA pyrophosphatase [Azospirillum thermophilum]
MEQKGLLHAGQAVWRISLEEVRRRFPGSAAASLEPVLEAADAGMKIRGDHDLNPDLTPPPDGQGLRDAAVLVPLVDRGEEITVIFTQRTANLTAHAGQISFPGGRMEPSDESAEDTALRETEEEIGLTRDRVEILGRLDTYVTRTGFRVTPVVGLVQPPFTLTPDPTEVAEVFEVPLSFILDPENPRRHSREFLGKPRYFYAFPYEQRYIWGATAGMLVNLRDVLGGGPLGEAG